MIYFKFFICPHCCPVKAPDTNVGVIIITNPIANYSMLITLVGIYNFVIDKSSNYIMEKGPILNAFGHRVQELRKERNLSQEQLADLAGVHRTYIGMIERAEKNITLCNIERIAKALKLDIKDLF